MQSRNSLWLVLLFLCCTAAALPGRAQFYTRLQQFTAKDGYKVFASPGYVTQDKEGLLWIGGDNGLMAFDGVHFKSFHPKQNDSTSLPSNLVLFNYQDRQGIYWVAVPNHGLYRYRPQTASFEKLRYANQQSFDINKQRYRLPFETKNGDLWFPLPGFGLARWDGSTKRMIPYPIYPGNESNDDRTYWMSCLTEDPDDGTLWLGSSSGLIHFFPQNGAFALYTDSTAGMTANTNCFYWDEDKTLWLGTWSRGLKKFDRRTKTFTSYLWSKKLAGTLNICQGIGRLDARRLWIATADNGQLVFDKQTGRFAAVTSIETLQSTLNTDIFFQNAAGVIWTASRQALTRIHPSENKFAFRLLSSLQKEKPDAHLLYAFLKADSLLYTGFYYYGDLVTVNENNGRTTVWPNKAVHGIRHLSKDRKGNVWIATSPGMQVFSPSQKRFQKPFDGLLDSLRVNDVLHSDDGTLWLATNRGLAHCLPKEKRLVWVTQIPASPNDPKSIVYQLYKDENNNLWFGIQRKGLGCVKADGSVVYFKVPGVQPVEQKCVSLSPAADGRIFYAVENLGLCELSHPFTSQQNIRVFNTSNGLPSDEVFSILKDSGNRQWLATSNGLCLLDEKTMRFRRFGKEDGLFEDYIDGGLARGSDGSVYLGFFNNYQRFLPAQLLKEKMPTGHIQLFSLRINGEERPSLLANGSRIELSPDESSVAFEAAFLNEAQNKNYKLLYRLDGVDKDWQAMGEAMNGQYNALPPGHYRLHIKAVDAGGKQLGDEYIVAVRLKPPWYKSVAFYIALSFLLTALVAGFHFYRVAEIKKRSLLKQALNRKIADTEMRALRAQMNPHFIFNCLGSINRYIVKSDHKTASNYLTKFSKLIRLILDNSASDTITLDREIQTLQLYLDMEALRFDHAFEYEIDAKAIAQPESVVIPSMLLQPYVENAIWHGLLNKEEGGGKLTVRFSQPSTALLRAEIMDNGVGRAKAKELASADGVRKSYGMQISRERLQLLNELHDTNAAVQIEDLMQEERAAGTKVILEIPIPPNPLKGALSVGS